MNRPREGGRHHPELGRHKVQSSRPSQRVFGNILEWTQGRGHFQRRYCQDRFDNGVCGLHRGGQVPAQKRQADVEAGFRLPARRSSRSGSRRRTPSRARPLRGPRAPSAAARYWPAGGRQRAAMGRALRPRRSAAIVARLGKANGRPLAETSVASAPFPAAGAQRQARAPQGYPGRERPASTASHDRKQIAFLGSFGQEGRQPWFAVGLF